MSRPGRARRRFAAGRRDLLATREGARARRVPARARAGRGRDRRRLSVRRGAAGPDRARLGAAPRGEREQRCPPPRPRSASREVDERLTALAAIRGSGSAARRAEALRELFARATAGEREFLLHLLAGELRQGALAGVMLDAIASAAALPAASVRRAAMYAPSLGAVARAALAEGEAGLAALPARAHASDRADARADGGRCRGCAGAARRSARLRVEAGRRAHPGAQARRRRARSTRAVRTRSRAPCPRSSSSRGSSPRAS